MGRGIAFQLFGNIVKHHLDYFDSLDDALKKSKMKFNVHEYVCSMFFFTLVTFMLCLLTSSFVVAFMLPEVVFSYTFSIVITFIACIGVFSMMYYYPFMKANNLKSMIDRNLPFAVFYMSTSAASGMNPVNIFKSLSTREGLIAKECSKVYTNATSLGMNLTDAIAAVANKTPSKSFSDLLYGMSSVITTGGSMTDYLSDKSVLFMNQYKRKLDEYSKQIMLYTEIYITLVIVGSLFFIVLTSIMSAFSADVLMLQIFLVFIMTPMASAGFIVLLKGLSPIG